jgi:hypothetical protein
MINDHLNLLRRRMYSDTPTLEWITGKKGDFFGELGNF